MRNEIPLPQLNLKGFERPRPRMRTFSPDEFIVTGLGEGHLVNTIIGVKVEGKRFRGLSRWRSLDEALIRNGTYEWRQKAGFTFGAYSR